MEYSLQTLNQRLILKNRTIEDIVDTLNLIGFEVDDLLSEKVFRNEKYNNIRLLIKIPSNREDLLIENLLLTDFSTIFNATVKQYWRSVKYNYTFISKQLKHKFYNYSSYLIDCQYPELFYLGINTKISKQIETPIWIQKKLSNFGINSKNSIEDILLLIEKEWGQSISIIDGLDKNEKFTIEKNSNRNNLKDFNENTLIPKDTFGLINSYKTTFSYLGYVQTDSNKINIDTWHFHIIFYDIHENLLKINPLATNVSLRYLRSMFCEKIVHSFNRLLTLLELCYEAEILPTVYLTNSEKVFVKNQKILKLQKKKLLSILNITEYDPAIFQRGGLKLICNTQNELYFHIPNTRKDLLREIDLIEEYSRFIGYKNFKELSPTKTLTKVEKRNVNIEQIKNFFLFSGFSEVITNPIQDNLNIQLASVSISNPLNNDLSFLRSNLLTKLIPLFKISNRSLQKNTNIFEIGRVFQKKGSKIYEYDHLGGIFTLEHIKKSQIPSLEWFEAKGLIENFLRQFGYHNFEISMVPKDIESPFFYSTRSIVIHDGSKLLGHFGELNPNHYKDISTKYSIYLFEFDLSHFKSWRLGSTIKNYKEHTKYPIITKDLSIKLLRNNDFNTMKRVVKENSKYLKDCEFFNVYFGQNNDGLLTVSMRLYFQSFSRTLLTNEIEIEIIDIKNKLINQFELQFID